MTTFTGKIRESLYLIDDTNKLKTNELPFTLGCLKDQPDSRDYQTSNILSTKFKGKNNIDYTNEMSPVKSQKSKASCVGFAIAAVVEWQQQQQYLKNKQGNYFYVRNKPHYNLSEQWIYHNAKKIDPWGEDTEGTSIRCGMKIINKIGVPEEGGWPYSDSSMGEPKFWAYSTANWNKNKKYYRINSLNELRKTLRNIGPCVIGILVFNEFYYPNNQGVIRYPNNPDQYYGAHAVCVVGDYPKDKLIKIKNSWGITWGKGGYGYLHYNYVENFTLDAWITIDDVDIKQIY